MAGGRISVLLADDSTIVREGVRALLSREPDIDVVGTASDYAELVAEAERGAPQVIVTDIRMPPGFGQEGITAANAVRRRRPETGVVILSQYREPEYAISALAEGAAGCAYLLKDRVADGDQLARAIREVARGGSMLDPAIVEALVAPLSAGAGLSREEQALLGLVGRSQLEPALLGTELAGYRLEEILGHGGMSVVYRAEDTRLKRKVALKLLEPGLAGDELFRSRFVRESEAAASLDHPNVIPIYEAGSTGGLLFIAMRYVDGPDLGTVLATEGPLDPGRAIALIGQVADALDTAHAKGLVHRDVKPANVLVAAQGGREHCYLTDFGITTGAGRGRLTQTGQLLGTIDYVAPEQLQGLTVDARADVYSLGCVLYECLTGAPPYAAERVMAVLYAHATAPPPRASERREELSRGLDDVIARALAKEPNDRYSSCGGLVQAARAEFGREGR